MNLIIFIPGLLAFPSMSLALVIMFACRKNKILEECINSTDYLLLGCLAT